MSIDVGPDCRRGVCDGLLYELPEDELLPRYMTPLECLECGEVYLRDDETGRFEVDA
jgi:hypothetical protein